eukprot:GHVU01215058.1.p1 GENE.GHVU01215058.1~~GHVU01215058.1.p1  ORF type:complete len:155 (+),score=23.75 GHVU01215058.1:67-465(+)
MGYQVGTRMLDVLILREKSYKREIKLIHMLVFIKSNVWKNLFGKEADKLEQATDDERTFYIVEKEPLVNKFISVPKDKGVNCASFAAGIIEAVLNGSNFPAKVSAIWYKGMTYYVIKFEESVIARDKMVEGR